MINEEQKSVESSSCRIKIDESLFRVVSTKKSRKYRRKLKNAV